MDELLLRRRRRQSRARSYFHFINHSSLSLSLTHSFTLTHHPKIIKKETFLQSILIERSIADCCIIKSLSLNVILCFFFSFVVLANVSGRFYSFVKLTLSVKNACMLHLDTFLGWLACLIAKKQTDSRNVSVSSSQWHFCVVELFWVD